MARNYQSLYVNINDRKQSRNPSGSYFSKSVVILSIFLFLTGALGKVYLDGQTKSMILQWQKKYEQRQILKKEAENLAIVQEKYMGGNHILDSAEKLNLRPAEPGQVRVLKVKPLNRVYRNQPQDSLLAAQ